MGELVYSKWCKNCSSHHPVTPEFWEFRPGTNQPYRCKVHRQKQYHKHGGKENAQKLWASMTDEQREEINKRRRERYKERKKDKDS